MSDDRLRANWPEDYERGERWFIISTAVIGLSLWILGMVFIGL